MKKWEFMVAVASSVCLIQPICGPAKADGVETRNAFFSIVDPSKTEGFLVVRRIDPPIKFGESNRTFMVVDSWSGSNFISEFGSVNAFKDYHIFNTNVSSSGTIDGTNWEYRSGNLIIDGVPGAQLTELQAALGGETPEYSEFEKIMGRGMSLKDFHQLKSFGDEFHGVYNSQSPIIGKLIFDSDPLHVSYEYVFDGLTNRVAKVCELELQPFPTGGFLPSRLKSSFIANAITNVEPEYQVVEVGEKPLFGTLSPFIIFSGADQFLLNKDVLYHKQLGELLPVPDSASVVDNHNASTRYPTYILFFFITCVFIRFVIKEISAKK